MAKALMDSRMLDLPLNVVFYKWLLGLESSLGPADLHHVDPALALHLGTTVYDRFQSSLPRADLRLSSLSSIPNHLSHLRSLSRVNSE